MPVSQYTASFHTNGLGPSPTETTLPHPPCVGRSATGSKRRVRPAYEVRFSDGRPGIYFYWDDNPGRASITQAMTSKEADRRAKELARAEQEKLR